MVEIEKEGGKTGSGATRRKAGAEESQEASTKESEGSRGKCKGKSRLGGEPSLTTQELQRSTVGRKEYTTDVGR